MNLGKIWVCAGLALAALTNTAYADNVLRLPSTDGEESYPLQGRLRVRSEEPPLPTKAPRPAVQREILAGPQRSATLTPAPAPAKLAAAEVKTLGEVKPKPRPAAKGKDADGCGGGEPCADEIAVRDGSLPVLNHRSNPYMPRMLPPGAGIDWPAPQFAGALIMMPTGEKGQIDDNGIARSIEPPPVKRVGHVEAAEGGPGLRLTDWQKDDCLDSIVDQLDDPASLQLTSDFEIDPRAAGQGGGGGSLRVAVDLASLDSKGVRIDSRLICTFEQQNGEWQFAGSRLRAAYRRPPSVM